MNPVKHQHPSGKLYGDDFLNQLSDDLLQLSVDHRCAENLFSEVRTLRNAALTVKSIQRTNEDATKF